jgi:hypothetical protein
MPPSIGDVRLHTDECAVKNISVQECCGVAVKTGLQTIETALIEMK